MIHKYLAQYLQFFEFVKFGKIESRYVTDSLFWKKQAVFKMTASFYIQFSQEYACSFQISKLTLLKIVFAELETHLCSWFKPIKRRINFKIKNCRNAIVYRNF